MRILHVIPGLSESSGPTQVVADLCAHQAQVGHDVTLCYVRGRGTDPQRELSQDVALRGFSAHWLRRWAYSPTLRDFLDSPASRADVLHIHSMWLYPTLAASRAAMKARTPYVVRPAGSLEPWCFQRNRLKKSLYLSIVERRILNHAAAIHAVSQQEAENVSAHGFFAPTFVTPNGIDVPRGACETSSVEHRRRLGLPLDRPLILFLSRIHEKKGLDLLGPGMLRIRQQIPHALLVIAGPDQHRYALKIKKLYDRLGLADNVRFVGEITGERKRDAYRAADVFVLPTRSENFGVVVLEAMAEGLPVVVSRNAPWEVVEKEGAGVWAANDPLTIADSVIRILTNPSLRDGMSQRATDLARNRFSWSAVVNTLDHVYRNIVAGRGPSDGLDDVNIPSEVHVVPVTV